MRIDPTIVRQQIGNLKVSYPDLFEDEDDWLLTLDSETDLNEFLDMLIAGNQEDAAFAGGLATAIAEMELRQARFEHRIKARKKLMQSLLDAAGIKKAERPLATLSIRNGTPKVIITDEHGLPDSFVRITRAPDRQKIKEYLTMHPNGSIAGAVMSNGEPSLSVRVK